MKLFKYQFFILCFLIPIISCQMNSIENSLEGAWSTQMYTLKDGGQHVVKGHIFFTEKDWTVLFFVMDDEDKPQRGSAEGGTYLLIGDSLEFKHHYNLSAGNAIGDLAQSPLRMEIRSAAEASQEKCSIKITQNQLSIYFPSGNSMTFLKK